MPSTRTCSKATKGDLLANLIRQFPSTSDEERRFVVEYAIRLHLTRDHLDASHSSLPSFMGHLNGQMGWALDFIDRISERPLPAPKPSQPPNPASTGGDDPALQPPPQPSLPQPTS